jgi:zona occludens toxin (predicted ATPase)
MLAILLSSHMTFAEPTAASGSPSEAKSTEANAAEALVSRELIGPLAAKERNVSRFSRARLPPQDRRVRILDEQPRKDAQGSAFVRFAIDARHGIYARAADDESRWRLATITGCVYVDRNQVFVKNGDEYRAAAFLLGKNLKAAAESTCQPLRSQLAHSN